MDIFDLDIKEFEKEIDKLLENMTDERITRKWIVRGEIMMKMIKKIIILVLILILASNITYAKGAHVSVARISGARVHSSTKTYTKSSTSKSSSTKTDTTNVKGFNSDVTTSTTLIPNWVPFLFLMHGNNYSINGEDKKIDYTLSNIAIKII